MIENWNETDDEFQDETTDSEATEIETGLREQLDSTENQRTLAALPDGRALVVSGPGAGTAVLERTDHTTFDLPETKWGIADRNDSLSGSRPVIIVHCPHQNRSLTPRLLGSIVASTGGSVNVAASVRLPSATTASHSDWLNSCAAASLKIADPAGYLLDNGIVRVKPMSDRSQKWASHLNADPLSPKAVLAAQRAVGANLLLSDGRALDPGSPDKALRKAFDAADDALSELHQEERLALNLTLPAQWLKNADLREKLFAELIDQEQFDLWHIRVQWPSSLGAFEQPKDSDLLNGYKRLAQLAEEEERTLLLPQTGLTGWLQLGFGAAGFGVGATGSLHAFKEEVERRGGSNQQVPRYFEPSLLHAVERAVHDALRKRPGYVECDCPFCPSLHAAPDWDHKLASLHHMHWLGRLCKPDGNLSRSVSIRRTVRTAVKAATGQPLAGKNDPKHLRVWDHLL